MGFALKEELSHDSHHIRLYQPLHFLPAFPHWPGSSTVTARRAPSSLEQQRGFGALKVLNGQDCLRAEVATSLRRLPVFAPVPHLYPRTDIALPTVGPACQRPEKEEMASRQALHRIFVLLPIFITDSPLTRAPPDLVFTDKSRY
jgi:hypothetical protein